MTVPKITFYLNEYSLNAIYRAEIAFNFSETQTHTSSCKPKNICTDYRLYNSSVPFFLNKCFVSVLQIYCRNDFASSLLSTTKQVRNSKQEMRSVGMMGRLTEI